MATQNTRAEFRKKLLHLMIPISLQQLMMALVNASDAFMLGFVSRMPSRQYPWQDRYNSYIPCFCLPLLPAFRSLPLSTGAFRTKGSGKDAGHRSGIFRAALPSLYHRRNIFPGTADACIRL